MLVTYFADAPTWDLEVTAQLATAADPILDDLAAGARLRASLAAAHRLTGILHSVAARPTFRYTQSAQSPSERSEDAWISPGTAASKDESPFLAATRSAS